MRVGPRSVTEWTGEEWDCLYHLALAYAKPHGLIVECGTFIGQSTRKLYRACVELDCTLVSVDRDDCSTSFAGETLPRLQLIRSESVHWLKQMDGPFSLAFLDSCHEAPHVTAEINALKGKVNTIIIHDWCHRAWGDSIPVAIADAGLEWTAYRTHGGFAVIDLASQPQAIGQGGRGIGGGGNG